MFFANFLLKLPETNSWFTWKLDGLGDDYSFLFLFWGDVLAYFHGRAVTFRECTALKTNGGFTGRYGTPKGKDRKNHHVSVLNSPDCFWRKLDVNFFLGGMLVEEVLKSWSPSCWWKKDHEQNFEGSLVACVVWCLPTHSVIGPLTDVEPCIYILYSPPPPKFHIAPEKSPSQKYSSLPTIMFKGLGVYNLERYILPDFFHRMTHRKTYP